MDMYEKQIHVDRLVDRPNTYYMVQNDDGTVTIQPAWQMIAGTIVGEVMLNHMEDGIYNAYLILKDHERRFSRIDAYLDLDGRGVSGAQARFADTFDGPEEPVLHLDQTKTYATALLSASATSVSIPVASTSGFAVGQEVTICDDIAFENQKITAIGTGTLSFASLANNYKKGALIGRSTVRRENQKLQVSGWGTHTITMTQA